MLPQPVVLDWEKQYITLELPPRTLQQATLVPARVRVHFTKDYEPLEQLSVLQLRDRVEELQTSIRALEQRSEGEIVIVDRILRVPEEVIVQKVKLVEVVKEKIKYVTVGYELQTKDNSDSHLLHMAKLLAERQARLKELQDRLQEDSLEVGASEEISRLADDLQQLQGQKSRLEQQLQLMKQTQSAKQEALKQQIEVLKVKVSRVSHSSTDLLQMSHELFKKQEMILHLKYLLAKERSKQTPAINPSIPYLTNLLFQLRKKLLRQRVASSRSTVTASSPFLNKLVQDLLRQNEVLKQTVSDLRKKLQDCEQTTSSSIDQLLLRYQKLKKTLQQEISSHFRTKQQLQALQQLTIQLKKDLLQSPLKKVDCNNCSTLLSAVERSLSATRKASLEPDQQLQWLLDQFKDQKQNNLNSLLFQRSGIHLFHQIKSQLPLSSPSSSDTHQDLLAHLNTRLSYIHALENEVSWLQGQLRTVTRHPSSQKPPDRFYVVSEQAKQKLDQLMKMVSEDRGVLGLVRALNERDISKANRILEVLFRQRLLSP